MSFFAISTLITSFLSFGMAFFVIHNNRKARLNQGWFLVSFAMGIWSFGLWGVVNSTKQDVALVYQYVLDFGAIIIPVAYYRFTIILLGLEKKKRREIWIWYVATFVLLLLSFSSFFKKGVEEFDGGGINFWIVPGPLYFIFPVLFCLFMFYAFFLGIKFRKRLKGIARIQVSYVLISGVVGFLGGATNFSPQFGGVYPIGNYFVVLYIAVVVYAIVQHRLMGIIVIVSKMYVTGLVALFFYTLFYVVAYIDIVVLGGLYSTLTLIVGVPIAIAIAAAFFPFLNYIQKSSDMIFFRGYNPRKIIKDLSMRISGVIDLKQLVKILVEEFRKILENEEIRFVFIDQHKKEKDKQDVKVSIIRKGFLSKDKIKKTNAIYRAVLRNAKTIVYDELDTEKDKDLIKELDEHCAKIISPLKVRKKVVGIIMLGEKMSQDAYTSEDIEFLEIISAQAAIAFENARLYKETKDFNKRLEKEVKRATDEFQRTNAELIKSNRKLTSAYEKLTKLDRAKSEFLSIASHQLRTPLTSIKGFTSLLLEGTYGKITKSVRGTLEKVYISNERLIKLVEDLLNISRIESGRLTFDFKEGSIERFVGDIVDSMSIVAKSKNLKFKYKKPRKTIKPFVFDSGKMKEVVSNLIDNSIKYTSEGVVSIKLEEDSRVVRIIVEDSGIGIRKGELDYIFERFQRGEDVNQIHTEGVGLGLYVCKKVIEAHEGKLWAESDGLNKGSKFVVELKKNLKGDSKVEKKK